MTKEKRTVGVNPYQNAFLRLVERVNAAGLLRDAIDREMQRSNVTPSEFKQHYEAVQESDQYSVDEILDQAHSIDEFLELSPLNQQEA